jgi:hypothetical protein
MKKIERFDKVAVKAARSALDGALAGAGFDLGLSMRARGATYNDHVVTFKVEISIDGGLSKEGSDFIGHANVGNIPFVAEDLNAIITLAGKKFSIAGYKSRARKNPILIVNLDTGERRVISIDAALNALGKPITPVLAEGPNRFGGGVR